MMEESQEFKEKNEIIINQLIVNSNLKNENNSLKNEITRIIFM